MRRALEILEAWPRHRPLAALWGRRGTRFGETAAAFRVRVNAAGETCSEWIRGGVVVPPPTVFSHQPLRDLRAVLEWGRGASGAGGWIGMLSYDLGCAIEPAVVRPSGGAAPDRSWPLIELAWCPEVVELERGESGAPAAPTAPFSVGDFAPRTGRAAFESAVARAIDYIRAGDVFQVNLAHRLSATFEGSTRSLFGAMCAAADPWHGAYLEMSGADEPAGRSRAPRAVVSCSPELFLRVDRAAGLRRVVTRPMKGTRPAAGDPRELDASPKDRAELTMIIDLMRNDLGRVCRAGSVRVERAREIERHGGDSGVWQATATVAGELRDGVGPAELLAATFPAGSVTGAPKIRAMQIIDELEPVRRGPYCGGMGWFGNDGTMELNVAIRTALVSGGPGEGPGDVRSGTLDYSVGAGIVADSDPSAEWRETMDKAAILRAVAPAPRARADEPAPAPTGPKAAPR